MKLPEKPYRAIPIHECSELLVPIPRDAFLFADPHPYLSIGAPYGKASPWMLRQSILASLLKVQQSLTAQKPGWRIKLFDAYRPNAVQAYMVEREFHTQAQAANMDPINLSEEQRELLAPKVFRVWGIPSDDPATPPPHSTGAAIDCTLVEEMSRDIDMGSPIDENSERSRPEAFASATDAAGKAANANRAFLHELMRVEGFVQNLSEWWHFSRGDQLAAWIAKEPFAVYGRADLLGRQ